MRNTRYNNTIGEMSEYWIVDIVYHSEQTWTQSRYFGYIFDDPRYFGILSPSWENAVNTGFIVVLNCLAVCGPSV